MVYGIILELFGRKKESCTLQPVGTIQEDKTLL